VHKYRGMLPTSLPTLLQRDIKMISGELRTVDDLETLREIAQDREAWRQMTSDILREKAKRWGDIVRIRTEAHGMQYFLTLGFARCQPTFQPGETSL
jgi:hypothetical protein